MSEQLSPEQPPTNGPEKATPEAQKDDGAILEDLKRSANIESFVEEAG